MNMFYIYKETTTERFNFECQNNVSLLLKATW